jgi:hypothetical protein
VRLAPECGEVAAEIELGDVIDADPIGNVEDARGDILAPVVDDMGCAAGRGRAPPFPGSSPVAISAATGTGATQGLECCATATRSQHPVED